MGVGAGIGGQFGFWPETAYGVVGTPNHFMPVNKAEFKLAKGIAQGAGIVAGQLVDSASQRVKTTVAGTGAVDMDLQSNGMGLLLQLLMGTTVTPVQQGATAAYLQTHTLADPVGKSLTMQVGVPDTAGVVHPYTASGCKITDATFTFDISSNAPAMASLTIDAANVVETQALASESVPTGWRPFVGTDVTIKVGTYGSEASVNGVTKADVKIPRPFKTNRFYFGNNGIKQEPITNARAALTGTITADYVDKTIWADRFAADTPFSLVVEAKGPLIASTFFQTFRITLPTCYLDGDTPLLSNEDVVNGAFPFSYLYDGTNLPRIEYISTDTTL
jgi:hypothetical protein